MTCDDGRGRPKRRQRTVSHGQMTSFTRDLTPARGGRVLVDRRQPAVPTTNSRPCSGHRIRSFRFAVFLNNNEERHSAIILRNTCRRSDRNLQLYDNFISATPGRLIQDGSTSRRRFKEKKQPYYSASYHQRRKQIAGTSRVRCRPRRDVCDLLELVRSRVPRGSRLCQGTQEELGLEGE